MKSKPMRIKSIYFLFKVIALVILGTTLNLTQAMASSDLFPIYPCIQPNVAFWKKVYSQYTSSQGIIHDRDNLNVIYGVIDLVQPDSRRAGQINKRRIREAPV